MGRKKLYLREQVVDSALQVFSLKGYEAVSLSDLMVATGLNKRSLYNEFVNKAGLFDVALERYIESIREFHLFLKQQPLGIENIRVFFTVLSEHTHANVDGCLLTLTLNESSLVEPRSLGRVIALYEQLDRLFFDNIWAERGKHNKTRPQSRILAKYLVTSVQGLTNFVRLRPSHREYRQVIDIIVSVLP